MKQNRKPGPSRFGTVDQREKEIVDYILFSRQRPRPAVGTKKSLREIADYLNATGQPPRRGKKWTAVMVWNVIERYYEQ